MPDLVEEEDFWCNFFYQLEMCKKHMGIANKLGEAISMEQRVNMMSEKMGDLTVEQEMVDLPVHEVQTT